ncbi:MAG: PorP/SprF family type IX secretion system membrane protein [Bacteroidetes bacterium]|nr:PorP/SprF family type IX secretion system membrane protein [Bacteroidota bacterium]
MKKIYLLLISILGLGNSVKSQDFHLSLYDAAPMFLNPAMTGLIDAKLRVHAQYRNQWSSVAFKPFTTALISGDMAKGKWGYGMQIINMRAGIGNYNAFQTLFSTAYAVPVDKQKYHSLSFGLQAGFTQKSIREDKYTFDSQYTSQDGGSFSQGINNEENINRVSQILPQLNAGFLYYYSKQQALLNPFLGVSGFNLTQPKETFFDQNNHLPVRITIHTGVRINITEGLYVLPKILVMKQGKALEQTYAVDAGYYLQAGQLYLLGGFVFRTKDASIVSLGIKKLDYTLRLGYDFNTSTLKTATKTRGAYEIAFTYLMGKDKMKKIKHCPRI